MLRLERSKTIILLDMDVPGGGAEEKNMRKKILISANPHFSRAYRFPEIVLHAFL